MWVKLLVSKTVMASVVSHPTRNVALHGPRTHDAEHHFSCFRCFEGVVRVMAVKTNAQANGAERDEEHF